MLFKLFDLADIVGAIGLVLIVWAGYLIVGWPVFLAVLGLSLVAISFILGSTSGVKHDENSNQ